MRAQLETKEITVQALDKSLCLLVMSEKGTFKCALPPRGELMIGRDDACSIHVDDAGVSRHHATLKVGDKLELVDLGSRNGTLVGDHRVTPNDPVVITFGDTIRIGDTVLVVQATSAGSAPTSFSNRAAFEAKVDEELRVARSRSSPFGLVRVVTHKPDDQPATEGAAGSFDRLISEALRPVDLFSSLRPGDYEIALPDVSPSAAEGIGARIRQKLGDAGHSAAIGIAMMPENGTTRAALQRAASARLVDAPPPIAAGVDMRTLLKLIPTLERIASGTINVLILGETGVGKDVVAHAIHDLSPRSSAPMVCLNCCALSETLLESELFGHERGAFTGAVRAKMGHLEAAHGGTFFLDEIGEMSLALQVKLLRVLEQKEVTRVGGLKPRSIDVRILAATNRDLQTEVDAGRFRRDLFFRLSAVSAHVPPLRERPDEIEPLTRRFVAWQSELSKRPPPEISPEVFSLFRTYPWPGNIRELRNVAERAVLLSAGETITLAHMPVDKMAPDLPSEREQTAPATQRPPPPESSAASAQNHSPSEAVLEGFIRNSQKERDRIIEALRMFQGNQTKAAEALGMSRRTLVSRMTEYELPRPRKSAAAARTNRNERERS